MFCFLYYAICWFHSTYYLTCILLSLQIMQFEPILHILNLWLCKVPDLTRAGVSNSFHVVAHAAHLDLKWAGSVKIPFRSFYRSLTTHLKSPRSAISTVCLSFSTWYIIADERNLSTQIIKWLKLYFFAFSLWTRCKNWIL